MKADGEQSGVEALVEEQRELELRVAKATTELQKSQLKAAESRRKTLELEHRIARRSWVRLGEPVVACVLLLGVIYLVGFEGEPARQFIFAMIGVGLGLWLGGVHR